MARIKGTGFKDVIIPLGTSHENHGAGFWVGGSFYPWPLNWSTPKSDDIDGGAGDDYIDAGGGDDEVRAGAGSDIVKGGSGNDKIFGGSGADTVIGGLNSDDLTGGLGADTYVYTSIDDSRATAAGLFDARTSSSDRTAGDKILDFAVGEDKVDVASIPLTGSSLPAGFQLQWKGLSPVATDRAYSIWYERSGSNTDVKADTNGDGVADLAIRLSGSKTLSASDFVGVSTAPVITSDGGGDAASLSIAEGQGPLVTTVTATGSQALTYSIASTADGGGADADFFQIDFTSGALSFKKLPDFEHPMDVGGDNVFDVTVRASAGSQSDTQDIAITLTDFDNVYPDRYQVLVLNNSLTLAYLGLDQTGTLTYGANPAAVVSSAGNGDSIAAQKFAVVSRVYTEAASDPVDYGIVFLDEAAMQTEINQLP